MRRSAVVAAVLALAPAGAMAARTVHVDGDAGPSPCVGDGSEAAPFGSIACAFAAGGFGAGDAIVLHDAAVPYEGASTEGLALGSGTAGDPVLVTAAEGEAPIVGGSLDLVDVSHWTVRGLTFIGDGTCDTGNAPAAIRMRSVGAGMAGLVAAENVILDWPGRAIELDGSGDELVDLEIRGNRMQRACGHALWVWSVDGSAIVDNDISDVRCATSQFSLCTDCGLDSCWQCGDCLDVLPEDCVPGAVVDYDYGALIGMRILADSSSVEVAYNRFHDFTDTQCGVDGRRAAAIYATRTESNAGYIHHNLVERIAPGEALDGYGILLMQGAEGWSIDHNVVVEAGQCGLCENDHLFFGGTNNVWEHNTVIGSEIGIDLAWAAGSQLRGNLVVGARQRAVRVQTAGDGVPALDHNVYWPSIPDAIGEWDGGGALALGAWQSACDCDDGAVVGDPGLVVDPLAPMLTPAADGPAIDAVPAGSMAFHGVQADAGALEAPSARSAALASDRPDTIVVQLDNRVAPPLRGIATCTGIVVLLDGEAVVPTSCDATEDDTLEIVLAEPPSSAGTVEVAYADGVVTDSAAIGRRVDARLAAFVLPVDGAGEGGGADTTGAEPGGSSDGGDDGPAASGDDGCNCSDAHGEGRTRWVWLLAWVAVACLKRSSRCAYDEGA